MPLISLGKAPIPCNNVRVAALSAGGILLLVERVVHTMKSLRIAFSAMLACILCGTFALSAPAVKLHLSGVLLSSVSGAEKQTPLEKIALKKGDLVRYTIEATNVGNTPALNVKTVGPVPKATQYVPGSASQMSGVSIEYTVDGKTWSAHPMIESKPAAPSQYVAVRWINHHSLASHAMLKLAYEVRVK